ncbi:hypothetical protein F2Q70_00035380 [Brassica cretica]|uniref:Uncharacterized protein n=1 Tax=Brassica cretica TaxID=69181 RepID=A0A8S9JY34_BRACR|nr:hypothetical protein F2Q70_00035380 [Brassica cretica]
MRRHEAEVVVSPVGDRDVKWAGCLWAARVQILMARKRLRNEDALPSSFDPKSLLVRGGEIVFVPHYIDREEVAEYWFATCGLEAPPPEPWCPSTCDKKREDGVAVRRHIGEGGVTMRRHEAEVVVSPVGDRDVKWAARKRLGNEDALPSSFDPKSLLVRGGEIVFIPHYIDREEVAEYWFATCGLEAPPPEPWCPSTCNSKYDLCFVI